MQVANLGLYGIALAVFGAIKAKEYSDIVTQVTEAKACSLQTKEIQAACLCLLIRPSFLHLTVPMDRVPVHFHRMLLPGGLSCWNQGAYVRRSMCLLSRRNGAGLMDTYAVWIPIVLSFFFFFFCSLKSEPSCKKAARISWGYWFKKTLYYQVALLYMLARLITNVSQVGIWSHVQSESFVS